MVLSEFNISTLYGLLRDIKPNLDNIRILLEYNSCHHVYRFKVILNEWKLDELILISKCYSNRKYIYEIMHDIRLLYNLNVHRYEKDKFC